MNISSASRQSGLPAKTIRYYEEIGLLLPERKHNGYRSYDSRDIHRLRFLQRARGLGFSIKECRDLLELYDDTNRASADVRAMAQQRIEEIDTKIEELRSLRASLSELVSACHGDDRPDCPILDDLAGRKQ
ncbi:MAG TPA: Cu(I)-responsive transcriptional regulator [Hyphomicrobiales bacterium]|nr:Cu(I)-responsive transcriptional regulator [Rhodobiaceae bacterium]HXK53324.1 Cu(I)-responsive transcriptional regulator [Hyphomicrobiales bacterium]